MNIIEIFTKSLFLIISFDNDLWEIIILSLYVSIFALIVASILGFLIGYYDDDGFLETKNRLKDF